MGTEEFLLDRAFRQGVKQGLEIGRKDTITTMLKKLPPEQIAEITDIPLDYISSVKNKVGK